MLARPFVCAFSVLCERVAFFLCCCVAALIGNRDQNHLHANGEQQQQQKYKKNKTLEKMLKIAMCALARKCEPRRPTDGNR